MTREPKQWNESLEWFGKAIATLKPLAGQQPQDETARLYLRNSYFGRAQLHDRMKKFAEAAADWSQVIGFSPAKEQPSYRVMRAGSRMNAGMVKEAVADVDAVAPLPIWRAENRYIFARIYAIASIKIEAAADKQVYADKAMNLLREAVKGGWKPAKSPATEPYLASLRNREDFKQLAVEAASHRAAAAVRRVSTR